MRKVLYTAALLLSAFLAMPPVAAARSQPAQTFLASHVPFAVYSALDFKTPEEKLLLAYDAYVAKNPARLKRVHASLGNSPFEAYLSAWELLLEIEKNPRDAVLREQAQWFMKTYAGSYVAERFTTDYLSFIAPSLHKADDWKTFTSLRATLKWNADAENLRCWDFYHRVVTQHPKTWSSLIASSSSLMTLPKMYDIAPCAQAADILAEANPSVGLDVLLVAVQNNRLQRARQILNVLARKKGFPAAEARAVLSNPLRWYNRNKGRIASKDRRVILIAAYHLSRVSPEKAAQIASLGVKRLTEADRGALWSRLGYVAALNHQKESLAWYAKAGSHLCRGTPIVNKTACCAWQVRAALREGNWRFIAERIEALPPSMASEPVWQYWHARALDAMGKKESARTAFTQLASSRSYYGKLAKEALGKPALAPDRKTAQVPAEVEGRVAGEKALSLARTFYELGLVNEGHREWNWSLAGNSAEELLAKALWAKKAGITHRMINTAERVRSLGVESAILYPRPFLELISENARKNEIDSSWVYGVIRQESRFIVEARSRVGANGLMQLMPATAQWVASSVGLKGFRPEKTNVPEVNIALGTAYLRLLLERLEGNLVLATAGYNAGPHRAVAWRRTLSRPVEGAVFVETIPFDETRTYVQNVLANTVEYSRFDAKPKDSLKGLLGVITPTKSTLNDPI